jgi:hypothetical protein
MTYPQSGSSSFRRKPESSASECKHIKHTVDLIGIAVGLLSRGRATLDSGVRRNDDIFANNYLLTKSLLIV